MTLYTDMAPGIMRRLMVDFDLDDIEAAAILGNLGHESGGFKFLQELKPLVPGSKGGYGWAQWTGPRRRQFEAYCKRNGLNPASDKANYGFLFVELTGSEKAAVSAVQQASGLAGKVKAFEMAFERAGVKHYPSRIKYAEQALAAYRQNKKPVIIMPPKPIPPPPDIEPPEPTQPAPDGGLSISEKGNAMRNVIFIIVVALLGFGFAEFKGWVDFIGFI